MDLKSLMVDTKSAWIEYPGLHGFEVEVSNLSRDRLMKLRKDCLISKINRKTRVPEEELDEKKFIAKFAEATIKTWKGLKLKYLQDILLVDIGESDPETEVEYSAENAELLVSNSQDFDSWLNEVVFDLQNFRS